MQELVSNIQTTYEAYISIGKVMLLLTGILGLLMIKSNQRVRVVMIYAILGSLIILNPLMINSEKRIFGENNLYRLGMILIVPILSAYAITVLYKKLTDKKQKIIAMTGIIVLVAVSGRFVYTKDYFYRANNQGKVYDLALDLADCVTRSKQAPTIAVSYLQGVFIRQYNANIKLLCAPEITENWAEAEDQNTLKMRVMLSDPIPDMTELSRLTKELGGDYLILLEDQLEEDSPINYGFVYVDTFDGFTVFENNIGAE
jgi:hypothetical protein